MTDDINPYASPQVEQTLSPGAQWVGGNSPALRTVGIGLALVYFGIVLVLLAAIVALGATFVRIGTPPAVLLAIIFGAGIALLVGASMLFIGPLFCLAVPSESRAKSAIIVSVVFQFASIALLVSGYVYPEHQMLLRGISTVVNLTSGIAFLIFLRLLSLYIERPIMASRATRVLICSIASVLLIVGISAAASFLHTFENSILYIAAVLGVLLFTLIVFVMYANLVNDLRKILRSPATNKQ